MTAACNGCFIFRIQILTHVGYVFELHVGRSQINGEIQVTQLNYSHPQFELFTCLLLALFSQLGLHVEVSMPPFSSLAPWEKHQTE